jgi:hypothetical protein
MPRFGNTHFVNAQSAGQPSAEGAIPPRVAMFGRTKQMYSLRQEGQRRAAIARKTALLQVHREYGVQFQETANPPQVAVTLAGIGLGGLAGALLAAALL